jgi:hypothetical protein
MTIRDVALHLGVSWDVIKDIQKRDLARRFARPKLKHLRRLAIDEIAIAKGHRYLTVVLDLDSGAVVFVGDGKGAKALKPFWKRHRGSKAKIEAVATARAGPAAIVAAAEADVGPGQVVDAGDAFGGVGAVFAGSWHGEAPGRRVLPGDTPAGGKLFTDSARFPCYRLIH